MLRSRRQLGWLLLIAGPVLFLGPTVVAVARGGSVTPTGWASIVSLIGLLALIAAPFMIVCDRPPLRRRVLAHALIWAAAAVLPLVLLVLAPEWTQTEQSGGEVITYFALFATIAISLSTTIEVLRRKEQGRHALVPLLLLVMVMVSNLAIISEILTPAYDWGRFQHAASELLEGDTPYVRNYLYPPLLAQAFASLHRATISTMQMAGMSPEPHHGWALIFYLHQVLQVLLIAATWLMCYRLGRRLGLAPIVTAVIVSILMVANAPLNCNLLNTQINLWILDMMLLGALYVTRIPAVCGALIGVGGMLKIQPLIILLPWAARRRRLAIGATVVGMVVVLGIQTGGFAHWELWEQYRNIRVQGFDVGDHYRNSSIRSLLHHGAAIFVPKLGLDVEASVAAADGLYLVCVVLGLAWLVARVMARRRDTPAQETNVGNTPERGAARLWGDYADAFAAIVLLSPMVWPDHAVHMIPVIVWALAAFPGRALQIALGAVLVIGFPQFDLWPLGHVRLLGVLIVMLNASPLRDHPWPRFDGPMARRWQGWLEDALGNSSDRPQADEEAMKVEKTERPER